MAVDVEDDGGKCIAGAGGDAFRLVRGNEPTDSLRDLQN
jgi:hypothetical protein